MKFLKSNAQSVVVAIVVALVVGGTAYAAGQINGHNLKNKSVPFGKLDKKAQQKILAKKNGARGATGATGPTGSAEYTGANWGVIYRNTIGSPVAQLRGGPAKPPYGIGSVGIEVADTSAETEQISFGNELDFAGNNLADLTKVGFQVFTTGENAARGNNMPSIAVEVNPNGAGGTTAIYSSLQYNPANSVPNQWSPYIDATSSGTWGLTGAQFNSPPTAANCGQNGPRCSFAAVKAFLATGAGSKIYSIGISKGRDFAFQGAVDGLRINNDVYDFEPFGVTKVPAS